MLEVILLMQSRVQVHFSQQPAGFKFTFKFIWGSTLGQHGISHQLNCQVLTLRPLGACPDPCPDGQDQRHGKIKGQQVSVLILNTLSWYCLYFLHIILPAHCNSVTYSSLQYIYYSCISDHLNRSFLDHVMFSTTADILFDYFCF